MGRTSNVPYHQNVYDLLGIEPGESREVRDVIEQHEQTAGRPFPAAIRELYIATGSADPFDTYDYPFSPQMVLSAWALWPRDKGWLCIGGFKGEAADHVRFEGRAELWVVRNVVSLSEAGAAAARGVGERYTDYIFGQALGDWYDTAEGCESWLRTPGEPLAVPILDFLTEQLGVPECIARPGDVTTYTWRPAGGTVRVTADDPAHPDPLSAWWIHADTPERLAGFARLLFPWGTLRDTLRADTDVARDVWNRVRGS